MKISRSKLFLQLENSVRGDHLRGLVSSSRSSGGTQSGHQTSQKSDPVGRYSIIITLLVLDVTLEQMDGMGYLLVVTVRLSPWHSSFLILPSKLTQAVFLLAGLTEIFSSTPAGTTMGRNERLWGQMGVTITAGTLGWIMLAPAATAYAVLPEGVETIRPSP